MHTELLDQGCPHCPIFPTAASRRRGRISSPLVAVHPLRPATYHRLGGPLPHQQANRTQGSPAASLFIRLDMSPPDFTRSYQSFPSVIPDCRASSLRVTHPSALARLCKHSFAKDLHVLSILSAFILSQDQTLHSIYIHIFKFHLISLDVIFSRYLTLLIIHLIASLHY